jgi:probable addiction module antidote protein
MSKKQHRDFDQFVNDTLSTDEKRADSYLETALELYKEDNNEAALLVALRQVAQAKGGFTELARKTGLKRESLYRSLSSKGNPRFTSLKLILNALGYNLDFKHI